MEPFLNITQYKLKKIKSIVRLHFTLCKISHFMRGNIIHYINQYLPSDFCRSPSDMSSSTYPLISAGAPVTCPWVLTLWFLQEPQWLVLEYLPSDFCRSPSDLSLSSYPLISAGASVTCPQVLTLWFLQEPQWLVLGYLPSDFCRSPSDLSSSTYPLISAGAPVTCPRVLTLWFLQEPQWLVLEVSEELQVVGDALQQLRSLVLQLGTLLITK